MGTVEIFQQTGWGHIQIVVPLADLRIGAGHRLNILLVHALIFLQVIFDIVGFIVLFLTLRGLPVTFLLAQRHDNFGDSGAVILCHFPAWPQAKRLIVTVDRLLPHFLLRITVACPQQRLGAGRRLAKR